MKRADLYVRSMLDSDELDIFIKEMGGNPDAYMREAGLVIKTSDARMKFVSWSSVCRYFEIAARELGEPYLGLKWALKMPKDYRGSGPTIFLGSIANNMRHFLDMVFEYQKVHTNGVTYSYHTDERTEELVGEIAIVAGISVMGRRYVPNFQLKRVTFQHSEPDDREWYEKAFQCPVEFNAPRNTIVTDLAVLGIQGGKVMTRLLAPVLKTYLTWKVEKHPHAKLSITATLMETLPNVLGVNNSDIISVSEAMSLHPKKLQRLLSEEGTNYSAVLDNIRKSIAERLLAESDISIIHMAKMLDYSSDRPFTAASKRWFEMTPTQYRKYVRN